MFLVRLIDVFVGILEFVFKSDKRGGGAPASVLGTVGIITLLILMVAALGVPQVSYLTRTSPFYAELSNASGLTSADPVLVAGVPTGRIESVALAGDRVRVAFRLDNGQPLGNKTTASVRLRTVLGKRYLEITPRGSGPVGGTDTSDDGARTIPLSRTSVPYSLDDISHAAVGTAAGIDPQLVSAMMSTMNSIVPSSSQLGDAIAGTAGATSAINATGTQLNQLLKVVGRIAEVGAGQSESIATTLANTQILVQSVAVRRLILSRLVDNIRTVLHQMATTFPHIAMGSLTTNLVTVTDTLRSNVANIDTLLKQLPPAIRTVVDTTGNGNWADVVSPSAVIPDGMLCVLGVMQGCK